MGEIALNAIVLNAGHSVFETISMGVISSMKNAVSFWILSIRRAFPGQSSYRNKQTEIKKKILSKIIWLLCVNRCNREYFTLQSQMSWTEENNKSFLCVNLNFSKMVMILAFCFLQVNQYKLFYYARSFPISVFPWDYERSPFHTD